MDWSNENYVRLYTRDSVTWKLLTWEARSLLTMLIRKLDRAGVLDVSDHGFDGIAAAVDMPIEIVERAMPQLLKRGIFVATATAFVMPNFLDAQEAPQTDAQRKRREREKRRAVTMRGGVDTNSDAVSDSVTEESQTVTLSLAKLSLAIDPDSTSGQHVRDLFPTEQIPKKKKQKHQLPVEWAPLPRHVERLAQFGYAGAAVDDVVLRFRTHHESKRNAYADWDKAFDTWLMNTRPAMKFAPRQPALQAPLKLAAPSGGGMAVFSTADFEKFKKENGGT
jgi:hypothetical protein